MTGIVRAMRDHCGLSQGEVAQACGISNSHLSNIENENLRPSDQVMRRIFDYYLMVAGFNPDPDAGQLPTNIDFDEEMLLDFWRNGETHRIRRMLDFKERSKNA